MSNKKHIREVAIKNNDLYRSEPSFPNKKLILSLGLPQSVNHMYYNTRGGGKRLTKKAEEYIRVSRAKINAAIEDSMWVVPNNSTWYYLDIIVFMPDRKIRDSHNMLKLLLDTLEGVAYVNDYYLMPRIQGVEYDKDNPRVELVLKAQSKYERRNMLKNLDSISK